MKWTKSKNNNIYTYHGNRYSFAYYIMKQKGKLQYCKLLVETIAIPPAEPISFVMRVNSIGTVKRIVELLEL